LEVKENLGQNAWCLVIRTEENLTTVLVRPNLGISVYPEAFFFP